jgi:hypothetical protein
MHYILAVAEPAHLDGLDALLNDPAVRDWLGGARPVLEKAAALGASSCSRSVSP